MCLNIGIPKTIDFPFGTNEKLMVLGVLISKPIKVCQNYTTCTVISLLQHLNLCKQNPFHYTDSKQTRRDKMSERKFRITIFIQL